MKARFLLGGAATLPVLAACAGLLGATDVTIANDAGTAETADGRSPTGDATLPGSGSGDGAAADGIAPATCDPTKTPTTAMLSLSSDYWTVSFTSDELTAFAVRYPDVPTGVYIGQHPDFGPITGLAFLPLPSPDGGDGLPWSAATSSGTGLRLVLEGTSAAPTLFETSRASADAGFPTPQVLSRPGADEYAATPYLLTSGEVLYFSVSTSATLADLYRSERSADAWGARTPVDGINAPNTAEVWPVVNGDETTIFFASDRLGTMDIFVAHRSGAGASFEVHPVAALNTPDYDAPMWLSPDGCRLYYRHSIPPDRGDPAPSFYVATFPH